MATFHIHLMLFLLLSLLFLPTLRAVDFKFCGNGTSIDVTSVDVFRDEDNTSFKISGSTSKTITGGYMNVKVKLALIPMFQNTYDLCKYMACPVAPGAFVLAFDKTIPLYRLGRFNVRIDIFDSDDEELVCLSFEFRLSRSAAAAVSASQVVGSKYVVNSLLESHLLILV